MKSCEDIVIAWLNHLQNNGEHFVRNSDMTKLKEYGLKYFGKTYNEATYERQFRQLRSDYSWRFEDVSRNFPDRTEKTWKIKQKEGAS